MASVDLNNLPIKELKKLVRKELEENKKIKRGETKKKNVLKFIKSYKNKTVKQSKV